MIFVRHLDDPYTTCGRKNEESDKRKTVQLLAETAVAATERSKAVVLPSPTTT
jgi:hypothetical protein